MSPDCPQQCCDDGKPQKSINQSITRSHPPGRETRQRASVWVETRQGGGWDGRAREEEKGKKQREKNKHAQTKLMEWTGHGDNSLLASSSAPQLDRAQLFEKNRRLALPLRHVHDLSGIQKEQRNRCISKHYDSVFFSLLLFLFISLIVFCRIPSL